jgi:hypothetical protein
MEKGDDSEISSIFRKINKDGRFCAKVIGMVKEVEGKTQSLAECWRWLKGLLIDFIELKKENKRIE